VYSVRKFNYNPTGASRHLSGGFLEVPCSFLKRIIAQQPSLQKHYCPKTLLLGKCLWSIATDLSKQKTIVLSILLFAICHYK